MFEWFKKGKTHSASPTTDPTIVLLALGKCLEQTQSLLRLGQDEKAAVQLRSMALPAAKDVQNLAEAFKPLVDLVDLLAKTRQLELAIQILPFVECSARAAGGRAPTIAAHLRDSLEGVLSEPTQKPKSSVNQVTVVYICQSCGGFNNFLMSPCMTCGFLPNDLQRVRLGMFLSNIYLAANALSVFGHRISQGVTPTTLHKDFGANLERIPMLEVQNLLNNGVNTSPARSALFPTIPLASKCPKCSVQMKRSTDQFCHACAQPLALPAVQRFIIAINRALRITQEMITPPTSPAFGRLLGLLVAFENSAFESGESPSMAERRDALECMLAIRFLPTNDGVIRIIFAPDEIQIGMNETPGKPGFEPEKYLSLGDEWIAVHGYLQNGVPLR